MQFQFSIFSCLRQAESWHNSVNGWCDVEQSWTDGKRGSYSIQIPSNFLDFRLPSTCTSCAMTMRKLKALNSVWPSQLWVQCEKEWNCRAVRSLACQYSYLLLVTHYFRLWPVIKKTASNSQGGWSTWFAEFKRWTNCWTWKQVKHGETTGLLKLIPLGNVSHRVTQIRPLELRCLQRACTLLVSDLKSFLRWSLQNSFSHVDQTWRGFSHTGCSRHQPAMSVQLGACCCQPTTQFQIWCCPVQVFSFSPDPRLSKFQVSNSFWAQIDGVDLMIFWAKSGEFWVHGSLTWLCKTSRYYFEKNKKHIGDPPFTCQIRWSATDDAKISADRGDPQKYCIPWANGCKRRSNYILRRKKNDVKFQMSTNCCPERAAGLRVSFIPESEVRENGATAKSDQIRYGLRWVAWMRLDEVLLHRCNDLISYSYKIQALRSFMGLSTVMCYLHALIQAWGFTPAVCAFLVQRQSQSCCQRHAPCWGWLNRRHMCTLPLNSHVNMNASKPFKPPWCRNFDKWLLMDTVSTCNFLTTLQCPSVGAA